MYSILQDKAKKYIVDNYLYCGTFDDIRVYSNDSDPYINNNKCNIEGLIYLDLDHSPMELIVKVFEIYGVNVWCAHEEYYYKNMMGDDSLLTFNMKDTTWYHSWHINNLLLPQGTLSLLLSDPLEFIQIMSTDIHQTNTSDLFDTLDYHIHKKTSIWVINYWLFTQLFATSPLIEDIQLLIMNRYIQLLL